MAITPHFTQRIFAFVLAVCLLSITGYSFLGHGASAQLGQRSLQLSTGTAGINDTYNLSFTYATPGIVGSISVQFCSNTPSYEDACIAPAGFDVSPATLTAQTGVTGFTINNATSANKLILSRSPSPASAIAATYKLESVKNPGTPGSYFARLQTFASSDASGPASDYGGIAFAITNLITVTATVPPYLIFCTAVIIGNFNCANTAGDYVDFGELSSTHVSKGTSQMLAATNAANGYSVSVQGSTLASGTNSIVSLASEDVSRPGTTQFGFNLRSNVAPQFGNNPDGPGVSFPAVPYNKPDFYRFSTGDTLVTTAGPDDVRVFTSGYIVNVPRNQAPGIYVSTLTYICLANF
jgi:hypothetical protein